MGGPRSGARAKSSASAQPGAHTARKRFGQHFLADHAVIDRIVRAIDPRPGQALVEIGPGLGALTHPLRSACGELTVIELDRDLAQRLRRQAGLEVIEADVLKVDFAALADDLAQRKSGAKLRVVGNLPYNISTPVLFHLLQTADRVLDQHFMLQKEVVDRMAAAPGNKDFGRLTVMLQWRYRIEALLDVPPEAFEPPPRVHSAVVRMTPLALPPALTFHDAGQPPGSWNASTLTQVTTAAAGPGLEASLSALVTSAFSQRRKLLRHTLGRWIEEQGLSTPFDLQRRAEEVPVAEYVALAQLHAAAGV